MTKEIAIQNNSFEREVQTLQMIAKTAQASGLYTGVGGEAKIFMILLAAKELGIMPMQALNGGIYNIQGKVEISARMMTSMIRRAGHSIISKECNGKVCILEGKRADNGDTFTAQFSVEDAQNAGLMSRQNWKNYTEDMLYARAMSRLARRLFPDVIGTAYVEGEIRDTIKEKEAPIEPVESDALVVEATPETIDEINEIFTTFAKDYHEESEDLIKAYLTKYAMHWKKSAAQTVADYADSAKFCIDFMKWKKKQVKE
jgi:hypothetical protein